MNLLPSRYFGRATGQHRKPPARLPGQVVDTAFRFCEPCGVDTVVVVHGDGTTTCVEDHRIADGDPT